jgi:hypothetical protein
VGLLVIVIYCSEAEIVVLIASNSV